MSGRGQTNEAGIPTVAEDSRPAFSGLVVCAEFLLLKRDGAFEGSRLREPRGCATQDACLILPLPSND
jgi:hypothetical protein